MTQQGGGTYLHIYQEIVSDVVVTDVIDEDSTLHHKGRIVYDKDNSEWIPLPVKKE